ncbi:hypothetical protein ACFODQ_02710 [Comamonas sp. JC664]
MRDRKPLGAPEPQARSGPPHRLRCQLCAPGQYLRGRYAKHNNYTVDANGKLVATSQRVLDALGTETQPHVPLDLCRHAQGRVRLWQLHRLPAVRNHAQTRA